MIKQIVLKVMIILLLLSNNLLASNQNFFENAKMYFEKKDYDKSKFLFQKFLVFNPKDYLSYLYLAKIYKQESNQKETKATLLKLNKGRKARNAY